MRNKVISITVSLVIGLLLFFIVVSKTGIANIVSTFKSFSVLWLLLYVIVSVSIVAVVVWRWRLILISQGYKINYFKLLIYRMAGYAVSYITPSAHVGGEVARAYLLKKEGIDFSKGISTIIIDKSLEITSDVFFASLGAITIVLFYDLNIFIKALLIIIPLLLMCLITIFYYRILHQKGFFTWLFRLLKLHRIKKLIRFERKLEEIELYVMLFFKHSKKTFRQAFIISCLLWILMLFEYKIAILVFRHNVSLFVVFLALAMVGIAYVVPIPAALGVLEVGEFSMFSLIGLKPSIGVALSFMVRARDLVWTFLGIVVLSYYGLNYFLKLNEKGK